MTHPATKKRGADPAVPTKPAGTQGTDEHKLEQGLEESMAGSDPVSITQPAPKDDEQHQPDADEVSEDDNADVESEYEKEEDKDEEDEEEEDGGEDEDEKED